MSKTIIVTGASSGFGAMIARALADEGHIVYAGMRHTAGRNAQAVDDLAAYAKEHGVRAEAVELDVTDQASVDAAAAHIIGEHGRIDVVVHNAGHMTLGPVEAFTVEQIASIYDTNVLSTQRVNRAFLPHMRRQRDGQLIWIGSTSARGGTPPWLGPYFAAKAAEDSLAVSIAAEVSRFGIDSTIVVPGSFTTGTNHYAHAGHPDDEATAKEYDELYGTTMDDLLAKQAELSPADADPEEVGRQVAGLVSLPKGQRPFRVYVDPAQDGAEEVFRVGDRVRREFYRAVGYEDLLHPAS
ncbi:short-chain dehydrogenase/reductase [Paractinoplanes abujensis]|uniref:NAD(P)-dependent dehydrogenase (Short-subunit alcohol dehydrogenase family) n=1 Tax=Paractinoplanes abujensis TaxID=882441 RepID=A0A7W7CRD4_9ACTN|nr:SDR family oxidoreductase [Actinoplanes abujensis]MBB4693315.1 NAD(P)-dependent dehydrogenase (short-subunit alcohol dehydrogenase family) [Actinoplanes abujensis]GID24516.1 short-chain dehydrogenase/reductase [Actinoplanes abujensis]